MTGLQSRQRPLGTAAACQIGGQTPSRFQINKVKSKLRRCDPGRFTDAARPGLKRLAEAGSPKLSLGEIARILNELRPHKARQCLSFLQKERLDP